MTSEARPWNSEAYHRLSEPQFCWGMTLLGAIELAGDERALDAGCGSGRLTRELAARVPRGTVVALDRNAGMVARAAEHLADLARVRCVAGDIADHDGGPYDLIFSTATFHWVKDHDRLFARLHAVLAPGGRLVAQFGGGAILERIYHRAVALACEPRFAPHFAGYATAYNFQGADATIARLRAAGFARIDVRLFEQPTVLPDAATYREFLREIVLGGEMARLPDEATRAAFADAMTAAGLGDDPPLSLDYWRLEVRAVRAG